jgi:hypothetical protein
MGSRVLWPSLVRSNRVLGHMAAVVGLRCRTILAIVFDDFIRLGAMVATTVGADYAQGIRSWLRFREQSGEHHGTPSQGTVKR